MNQTETFDLGDALKIVRRNFFLCSICIFLCAGIALALAFKLPKRFKSEATINIQTSYFQNPMVDGLITPVIDPQELQAQRMSLIRQALETDFLDSLAEKYDQYSPEALQNPKTKALERDTFSKNIEYYSLSSNTFAFAISGGDPELAQYMAGDILNRVKTILIDERYATLEKTKNAIQSHVKSLGDDIKRIDTPSGSAALQDELRKVESTLSGMLMKFTESHPEVIKLRRQQQILAAQVKSSPKSEKTAPSDEIMASGGSIAKAPSQEVYNDLLKKLNYLSIVLDMEKDKQNLSYFGVIQQPTLPIRPTFPNKKLFLAVGLVAGVLLASVLTLIAELGRRSMITPNQVSDLLDIPLLGELPVMLATHNNIKQLPNSGSKHALPEPIVQS